MFKRERIYLASSFVVPSFPFFPSVAVAKHKEFLLNHLHFTAVVQVVLKHFLMQEVLKQNVKNYKI
jgi:hypothetical protein